MLGVSVKVLQGIVHGCRKELQNGRSFLQFSGIPYAKKPINDLRFKSPQKLIKFDNPEIDCTVERSECFQKSMFSKEFVGSEDCLYLNVYVPEKIISSKLSVMVFIHGGGFCGGSSSCQWYSPEYLLIEDVIVVTLNYRLHALGFLSFPSMQISGNAGLKDQQMALEWVYENISNFNGDPESICLFGQSAGAASVHLHVLNKKSRKFIKSAICQSGCGLADWSIQRNPIEKTKRLASSLGCSNCHDDFYVYKTLMSANLENLLECSEKSGSEDEVRRNMKYVFVPSIEVESEDAFMSKSSVELIKEEDIEIPMIFGTTDRDGMLQTIPKLLSSLDSLNKDYIKMLPISLNVDSDSSTALESANKIKKFYFGEKDIGIETVEHYFDLTTDIRFLVPQTMSNELHASFQPKSKQYLYEFRYDGDLNLFKNMLGLQNYKGASHIDDIFYLFGQQIMDSRKIPENSSAIKMRSVMCKLWTNFAKYQNPTPEFNNPLHITWHQLQAADPNAEIIDLDYLVINEEPKMQRNLNQERLNFLRSVYRACNTNFISPSMQ